MDANQDLNGVSDEAEGPRIAYVKPEPEEVWRSEFAPH